MNLCKHNILQISVKTSLIIWMSKILKSQYKKPANLCINIQKFRNNMHRIHLKYKDHISEYKICPDNLITFLSAFARLKTFMI